MPSHEKKQFHIYEMELEPKPGRSRSRSRSRTRNWFICLGFEAKRCFIRSWIATSSADAGFEVGIPLFPILTVGYPNLSEFIVS